MRLRALAQLSGLVLLTVAIGVVDAITGIEVSIAIFYLIPVGIAGWLISQRSSSLLAFFGAASWYAADYYDGHRYSLGWIPVWNSLTMLLFLSATGWSVSALSRTLARERRYARVDHLTGLWNARAFYELAHRETERARRDGQAVTIGYFDLDDFKTVNDTLGHLRADELLVQVGRALREAVRQVDVVGRLGGDEFAVVLPGVSASEAHSLLWRLHAGVTQATKNAGFSVSISLGAISVRKVTAPIATLLRVADQAMYDAKLSGKNRVIVFEEGHR